jgi:sodium-independent sulfate anion transporter 11
MAAATKIGHGLAKGLGIKTDYRDEYPVNTSEDAYIEVEPTANEFLSQIVPSKAGVLAYIKSLFPFWNWIFNYNLQWLAGDLIAGEFVP